LDPEAPVCNVEVERRGLGSSLIKSSNRILEIFKAVGLSVAGIGSTVYAYWDGRRLLFLGRGMANAVIGGLILVLWATVLIKLSIADLIVAVRTRKKTLS
jgi:hypothetical protein